MIKLFKKFWNWGWSIYHKNEELWNYLISGALGVIISIVSYAACRAFGASIVLSNIISWIIAVLAMYITNKLFVFKSKCDTKIKLLKEFCLFVIARIFTLVVETIILFIGATVLQINDIIVKVIAQIIIIVLNYILSKILIFNKK